MMSRMIIGILLASLLCPPASAAKRADGGATPSEFPDQTRAASDMAQAINAGFALSQQNQNSVRVSVYPLRSSDPSPLLQKQKEKIWQIFQEYVWFLNAKTTQDHHMKNALLSRKISKMNLMFTALYGVIGLYIITTGMIPRSMSLHMVYGMLYTLTLVGLIENDHLLSAKALAKFSRVLTLGMLGTSLYFPSSFNISSSLLSVAMVLIAARLLHKGGYPAPTMLWRQLRRSGVSPQALQWAQELIAQKLVRSPEFNVAQCQVALRSMNSLKKETLQRLQQLRVELEQVRTQVQDQEEDQIAMDTADANASANKLGYTGATQKILHP